MGNLWLCMKKIWVKKHPWHTQYYSTLLMTYGQGYYSTSFIVYPIFGHNMCGHIIEKVIKCHYLTLKNKLLSKIHLEVQWYGATCAEFSLPILSYLIRFRHHCFAATKFVAKESVYFIWMCKRLQYIHSWLKCRGSCCHTKNRLLERSSAPKPK